MEFRLPTLKFSRRIRVKNVNLSALLLFVIAVLCVVMVLLFLNASATAHEDPLSLPDEDISGASQNSSELIAYIRQLHIQTPSGGNYKLQNPEVKDASQNGQGKLLANIFNQKRGGTFLEAGAYNGEQYSNTLYLERSLGWTGLLVEPDPWNFWALRKKSRNAHSVHCCLSPFKFPREVSFRQSDAMGRIVDSNETKKRGIFTRIKCFPLYSLLLAMNFTSLDLLSLDIEGKELQVLNTLPWDKIAIKAIITEVSHIPDGKSFLKKFLEDRGYIFNTEIGEDYVFVRK